MSRKGTQIPRRITVAFAAVFMALAALVAPQAASAAATASAVAVNCTAQLPAFPSNAPIGGTNNNGTCVGTWAGVNTNAAPTVTGRFSASFAYGEPCPPGVGTAIGTARIQNAPGTVTFDVQSFAWIRVGTVAVLVLDNVDTGNDDGAAVAVFAPTNLAPAHLTGCPGPAITAQVVAYGAWSALIG